MPLPGWLALTNCASFVIASLFQSMSFGKEVIPVIREQAQSELALEFSCMIIMPEPREGDGQAQLIFAKS